MNSVERTIIAATRAYGDTVKEIPPLELTPPGIRAPRVRRAQRAPDWRPSWMAPVAAAAVVVALAVALVAVRDTGDGRGVSPSARLADFAVPRYYVAVHQLGKSPSSTGLVIGDTLTGARLATIAAARGDRFVGVTGAADDRTFVVSTMQVPHGVKPAMAVTWYLLRIRPGSTPDYLVTKLAIPDMRSWGVQGIALSPSGRELAMTLYPAGKPRWVLRTYSVATGKLLGAWSTSASLTLSPVVVLPGQQNQPLSWADGDRAVVFQAFATSRKHGLGRESERMLDVTSRSGNLIADSRVVWSVPDSSGAYGCELAGPRVTADGKTVVCTASPVKQRNGRATQAWLAYSTSAPSVPRVLYKLTVDTTRSYLSGILWSDPSGRTLIVEWPVARSSTASAEHFGIISHGRIRPLPPIAALLPSYPGGGTAIAW